jgi:DNA-binding transcriptional LysR family regulator
VRLEAFTEIGSREAVWMAVERGIGVGVVSEFEFIAHPRLRPLRIRDAAIYTYAHVVCLAERTGTRLVKAFLGVVDDLLAARTRAPRQR